MPEVNEKKPVYFMMNAPGWFINLPDEEKAELAEQFSEKAGSGQPFTETEIADLLSVSEG